MKIKMQKNRQNAVIDGYEVPEDFIEVVRQYVLPSTQTPKWWLWWEDEDYEYEWGFEFSPLALYYEAGCSKGFNFPY
jgi:hypothetical protein